MKKKEYSPQIVCAVVVLGIVFILYGLELLRERYIGTRVAYFCAEGNLEVYYRKNDTAKVITPDGIIYELGQSVSASGVRYESGSVVFWSKGEQAFLSENNNNIFTDCISGTLQKGRTHQTATFTNQSNTWSITFPKVFRIQGADMGYTESWKVHRDTTTFGAVLLKIVLNGSYKPSTNLRDVVFTVGSSSDPEALRTCLFAEDPGVKKQDIVINSIPFTKLTFGDAGAGNFYDTTSYRTVRGEVCYTLEYTIHSLNIHNFPENFHIEEFNRKDVAREFDDIVGSFVFK